MGAGRGGWWPDRWPRRRTLVWGAVGVAAGLGLLLMLLGPVSWLVAGGTVRALHAKDRADALNAVRQTVLATVGGATLFAGLFYTARTYLLSRRGQVTERFRAGVEHLASDTVELRLGGVYGLEHVLAESAQEHGSVVSVLAAFVRRRTREDPAPAPDLALPADRAAGRPPLPGGTQPPPDVQAAVDVLARRPERHEPRRIDLRGAGLGGLMLRGFEFDSPPRLDRMLLTHADLRRADLRGAHARGAVLNFADLRGALLHGARLDGARLHRADLRGAALAGAVLTGADLTGADLRDCEDLTRAQVAAATSDATTRLPAHLPDPPDPAAAP